MSTEHCHTQKNTIFATIKSSTCLATDLVQNSSRVLAIPGTTIGISEKAGLEGLTGGAFGAFGWSGEAPERIYNTMLNIFNMKMVSGPLTLKSSQLDGGIQMAQQYGRDVAAHIEG